MPYRAAILSAIEKLKDDPLVGSPSSSIRHHIQQHDKTFATTALAANSSGSDDTITKWNETLYQTTLKSLITKKTLLKNSNGNYMYSDEYMQRRTRGLRTRAESIEDAIHQHATAQHQHSHPREEPPKEIPKKKTFHAKVKINEGKVITAVVNPESKKHGGDDEMDTDDGMSSESSGSNKKHVKIIPRRVCRKKM